MRRLGNCGPRALSRPGGLVLTARADQLHRMPLVCAVAADQHVLTWLNNNQTNITVLMSKRKESFSKFTIFTFQQSNHTIKLILNSSVRYHNDINFLIELSGKLIYNF
jgi:hypothetical protein